MATARSVLRQRVLESLGYGLGIGLTTTATSAASTITDTKLARFTEETDGFPNWWAFVTDPTTTSSYATERMVKRTGGYAPSITQTVFTDAFPTPFAASVTYDFSPFSAKDIHDAINRSAELLYRRGMHLPVVDETIVVDNILTNGDFETYDGTQGASSFTGWVIEGAGATATPDTTIFVHGTQSAKLTAGGGAAGQLTQTPVVNVLKVKSKAVDFQVDVFATTAGVARVGIDWDGSDVDYFAFNVQANQWETHPLHISFPSGATQVKVICEVSATHTARFDFAWAAVDPIYRYTIPTTFIQGPHKVSQQVKGDHSNTADYDLINHQNTPVRGRRLKLEGKDYLSRPSTEGGTMEVEGDEVDLIVAQAKERLLRSYANRIGAFNADEMKRLADDAQREVDRLVSQGIRRNRMGANKHEGWRYVEEGEARYLHLTTYRG